MKNFSELSLNTSLMQSLERMHFKIPTPIQVQAIPPALLGKDILGTAQTGTGKTLCYGIACINKLLNEKESSALIICPTRELAIQVGDVLMGLIGNKININAAVLIGGQSIQKQLKQLSRRPRLIIGTPGRLNDHLNRKTLHLHKIIFLVLDETDRMLDMGFAPQIEQILKFVPRKHQTLLFSATLPHNIIKIAEKYLNTPIRISVGSTTTPIDKIKQEIIKLDEVDKYNQLLDQLHKREGSILVFVKTKHGADKMVKRLRKDGHQCDCMHGNLRQSKRQRTLIDFRSGKVRILISTELAARGLDVPSIQHVINYHLPQVPEDFIHRIGRTARAGAEGSALTFITPADAQMWYAIQNLINPNIKQKFNNFKKPRHKKNKKFSRFRTRAQESGNLTERNYFNHFSKNKPNKRKKFKDFKNRGKNNEFVYTDNNNKKNYNKKKFKFKNKFKKRRNKFNFKYKKKFFNRSKKG